MAKKDYYKVLGVERGASDEDIKKSYRKLAHEHHPDKASGDEAKFKEINEAYQVLGNKEKRAQYDRFGQTFDGTSGGGAGGPFGGFGFNFDPSQFGDFNDLGDIFGDIFGGFGGGKSRHATTRGADLEMRMDLTLEEAYSGLKKKIHINTFVKCSTCDGHGHFAKDGFDVCGACDGKGEIREMKRSIFGAFARSAQCDKCSGLGKIPKKICNACRGVGRVKSERGIDIDIAPGIADGQVLKIIGGGEAGERGVSSGDLYVGIRVKPHHIFKRVGDDLVMKYPVSLVDILLGKAIKVSGISGKNTETHIPRGHDLRVPIKISGEAMPHFGRYGYGDLYIELEVKTPLKLDPELKNLLDRFNSNS